MENEGNLNPKQANWVRNRRKWYNFYLFLGVGINLLLYFTKPYGFDPSNSIAWGAFFGLGIPLGTMFLGTFIHEKLLGL